MNSNTVTLYVYDISQGMARTFSPMMLGKVVEGVWHSSVVVFNKEYYFQGGIAIDQPKTTPFGLPVKTLAIGTTELTEADLNEYLIDVKPQYTPESYNIFDHNCNHFSNALCEFLTGNPIPKDILEQAKEYRNTPIGQFIQGLENQHKNANPGHGQAPLNSYAQNFAPQFNQPQGGGFGQPGHSQTQVSGHSKHVVEVTDIIAFTELISANDRVVVDFYANWCGPCKVIKPEFERLAEANKGTVVFCAVNVDVAQEVSLTLSVTAMPTFVFLFKGEEVGRVQGGDPVKLRGGIEALKGKQ